MKKPEVIGIREYKEVLYPVWHSCFSQGDFQSIRNAIPEFKRATKILTEMQWHLSDRVFVKLNNDLKLTSRATDPAPEIDAMFYFQTR